MLSRLRSLSCLKNLSDADFGKIAVLAVISIPVALAYAFYKVNQKKPVSLKEGYDEHLFI